MPESVFRVAAEGSWESIKYILDDPINRNVDGNGRNVLHHAVVNSNVELVDALLSHGADPNAQDNQGLAALHMVGENLGAHFTEEIAKRCAIVDRLLCHPKIDIELRCSDERTPLCRALNRPIDISRKFIQYGADITNISSKSWTALHHAIEECRDPVSVIDELLKREEVDLDKVDDCGETALFYACRRGSLEVIQSLVRKGARADIVNVYKRTPLHVFCLEEGFHRYVEDIYSYGEDMFSYQDHASEAIKTLLRCSPDLINVQDLEGYTPLHQAIDNGSDEYAMALLECENIAINKKSNEKETPLHLAFRNDAMDVIQELVNMGADLNEPDQDGNTAVHLAFRCYEWEILESIIERDGVNVNARNHDGRTPLHEACACNETKFVEKLLKKGADVNEQDVEGNTVLHLACAGGSWEVLQILLEHEEVELQSLNKKGLTPLMVAANGWLWDEKKSLEVLFKLLLHTGGTLLDSRQIHSKNSSR